MSKKDKDVKRPAEPRPATYISISKTENGWHVQAQPGSRETFAPNWADVLRTITDWAGYEGRIEERLRLVITKKGDIPPD